MWDVVFGARYSSLLPILCLSVSSYHTYSIFLNVITLHTTIPYFAAIPALISSTYFAIFHGLYNVQGSDIHGWAVNIFITVSVSSIQIISSGINVFFIQKLYISDLGKMKIMPLFSAIDVRFINHFCCSADVRAISTIKHFSHIQTCGSLLFSWMVLLIMIYIAPTTRSQITTQVQEKCFKLFFIGIWLTYKSTSIYFLYIFHETFGKIPCSARHRACMCIWFLDMVAI